MICLSQPPDSCDPYLACIREEAFSDLQPSPPYRLPEVPKVRSGAYVLGKCCAPELCMLLHSYYPALDYHNFY